MREISISDDLYRQINDETGEQEFDETLWKMVGSYRRENNPESDLA